MGAIAALVLGGVSTAMQYKSQQEATKAQKQTQEMQARSSEVSRRREQLQAMREARIKKAQIISSSGLMGTGQETSGVAGSVGSIESQLGANIGYSNVQQGFADLAGMYNQKSLNAQSKGAMWQQVGNTAGSIFGAKGGWTTIFGGNTFDKQV